MSDLIIENAARFLVRFGDPAAVRRTLDAHVADASGHCATCRTPSGAAPLWPCRLHDIAEHAVAAQPDLAAPTPRWRSDRLRPGHPAN